MHAIKSYCHAITGLGLFFVTACASAQMASTNRGEPVEGVSVLLQVEKVFWELPETPTFRVSVRNQGGEILSVAQNQVAGELEMDGVWYASSNPYQVTRKPLAVGNEFDDIRVIPNVYWRSGLNALVAGPGKHKFRFAIVAQRWEQNRGRDIRAVSNPVEVEFQWPTKTQAAIARSTNGPAGSPGPQRSEVYFNGLVVDDETGRSITNFVLQWGEASPQKPGEITWTEGYSGPNMTGPGQSANAEGRFWAESYKTVKAWARILAEGYGPQPVTPEPVTPPVRMENLVVRMKRGSELHGIVLDLHRQADSGRTGVPRGQTKA